jgi:DNA-binding transcriptional ArsR family regulator
MWGDSSNRSPKEVREMETAQDRRRKPELNTTLAAILAHPLRCRILSVTAVRVASPKELAQEFEEPLGNVSYHVRKLEQLGLLELVEEKKRRGANEHFYRATELPVLDTDGFAAMSVSERNHFHLVMWQMLTANVGAALEAGTYSRRPEASGFRIPGTVDEAGWGELEEAATEFFEKIFAAVEASATRISKDPGGERIPMIAAGAFFESAV